MSQSPALTSPTPNDKAAACASVCKALVMLAAADLEARTGSRAAAVEFVDCLNRGEVVAEFIITLRPDHGRLLCIEYRDADGRQLERIVMETTLVESRGGPAWQQ